MSIYAKLAAGAAAILVVAVVGYQFLPSNTGSGGPPTPTAAPTPTPAPTAVPRLPESGPIEPGTYRMGSGPTFLITVPPGWASNGGMDIRKHLEEPNELALFVFRSDIEVFADACQSAGTEEPVGPTAADLLAALRAQENSEISDPVDATLGGLTGIRLEISPPAGLDISACSIGSLQIWVDGSGDGYLSGVGSAGNPAATVYIADTPGGRLALTPHHEPGATAADIAELDAMVASIEVIE
jgi:hypothetical protein